MPYSDQNRNSRNLSRSGQAVGQSAADSLMRAVYFAGPFAILVGAFAAIVYIGIEYGPWEAFRGFTAFFIPVMLGAYVLRRWPEWLYERVRNDERFLTLLIPFLVVLLIGGALIGDLSLTKWILGLAFLGLLIAGLFIVRIVDENDAPRQHNDLNPVMLDVIVGAISAAGLLVLFRV